MAERVTIFEMGPRDGLQNEKRLIPTKEKIRLVDLLTGCGFGKIETASFVSPKWVPQMADTGDVLAGIKRAPGTRYTALTPNMRGYERAREARADEVAIFASASEGFSRSNLNCSIAESLERMAPVAGAAEADGVPVRGYVSCVIECPFDGQVAPGVVADLTARLLEMGCYEVSLGDTIGRGVPETMAAMLEAVIPAAGVDHLAGHYHDTNGRACDNIELSLSHGLRTFDAAIAGLGGCPFAPGSKGNVATEAVVERVEALGFETGIDRARLAEAAAFAGTLRIEEAV